MSKTVAIINIVGASLVLNYLKEMSKKDRQAIEREFAGIISKDFVDILKKDQWQANKLLMNEIKDDKEKKGKLVNNIVDNIQQFEEIYGVSAEINTLTRLMEKLSGKDKLNITLYFLHTDTTDGKLCGEGLDKIYSNRKFYEYIFNKAGINNLQIHLVKTEEIINFGGFKNFNEGIKTHFIDRLSRLIGNHKKENDEIFINATGGYKAQSVYATLTGMLQKVPVIYTFERFKDYIELPAFPLSFDLALFHKNRVQFELVLKNNIKAYQGLPRELQDMFIINKDDNKELSPIGAILYNNYINAVSPRGRVKPDCSLINYITDQEQVDKVVGYVQKWDTLWEGDQLTQMVDHQHSHHQNVLNLAEQALSPILEKDRKFLSGEMIYFLVSSIFLHDIGHGRIYDKKGKLLDPDDIRKNHGRYSHDIILENRKALGLDAEEAKMIALLCKYHQKSAAKDEKEREEDLEALKKLRDDINEIEKIIALLRICDASDVQKSRVGEEEHISKKMEANQKEKDIYKKLLDGNKDCDIPEKIRSFLENRIEFIDKQKEHFNKHKSIELVEIIPDHEEGRCFLKIKCTANGKDGDIAFGKLEKNINEELDSFILTKTVKEVLAQKGIEVIFD